LLAIINAVHPDYSAKEIRSRGVGVRERNNGYNDVRIRNGHRQKCIVYSI